jgi:hypothetical protein
MITDGVAAMNEHGRIAGVTAFSTSASQAHGRSFSGWIDSGGHIRVEDHHDGQTWTTYYGPASANSVKLADNGSLNSLKLAR